jgi:hypothetical protein
VGAPVSVSGKLTGSDGKPVGGVTLNLQPLENGYAQVVPVKPDGSFAVETIPGKYAYFLAPKSGAKQTPPQLEPYASASMDRTVVIAPDKPAEIKLP